MFGLRDVLEPPKDETPAIVEDWAGGEPFNEPIVLRLDPDHPEDSIVMIRPKLDAQGPRAPSAATSAAAVMRSRAIVQRASRSGIGSTPSPGRSGRAAARRRARTVR